MDKGKVQGESTRPRSDRSLIVMKIPLSPHIQVRAGTQKLLYSPSDPPVPRVKVTSPTHPMSHSGLDTLSPTAKTRCLLHCRRN